MKVTEFVAIDFETMTAEPTSACAVGLAVVKDSQIQQKFYSLINPIPDDRTSDNVHVHGITREMCASAPSFLQLFPLLAFFMKDKPIVCHNRHSDIKVLRSCMDFFGLSGINLDDNYCTYEITNLSLDNACAKYGINMVTHHDALADAVACAKVFLASQGDIIATTFKGGLAAILEQATARKIDKDVLKPIDDNDIDNKQTPFYKAKVVITGVFGNYPNRNELASMLQKLGADINTAISAKTDIVVMGQGAGPSKIQKISDLRDKGHDIRIIYEEELRSILEY